MRDSLTVDAALLLVVVMWAATFSTFKVAWRADGPGRVHRHPVPGHHGGRARGAQALAKAAGARRRATIPTLASSGLTGYFLYQMGFVLGLDRTSAVASAILISTHPMFALLFSWLGGREHPTRTGVVGLLVGFGGVVVFLGGWNGLGGARVGDLLSLGAAACFGAYGAINQGLSGRYSGRELMAYTLAVGGTLIVLVSIPGDGVPGLGRGRRDDLADPRVRDLRPRLPGVRAVELGHRQARHRADRRVRVPRPRGRRA